MPLPINKQAKSVLGLNIIHFTRSWKEEEVKMRGSSFPWRSSLWTLSYTCNSTEVCLRVCRCSADVLQMFCLSQLPLIIGSFPGLYTAGWSQAHLLQAEQLQYTTHLFALWVSKVAPQMCNIFMISLILLTRWGGMIRKPAQEFDAHFHWVMLFYLSVRNPST